MMNTSTSQKEQHLKNCPEVHTGVSLHEPLLSREHDIEATTVVDDNGVKQNCAGEECTNLWDQFWLFLVLPGLVLAQFGIYFYYQHPATAGLSWTSVNVSVGLLTVISYKWRQSIQDAHLYLIPDCFLSGSSWKYSMLMTFIIFLPEITMDVALALVLLGYIQAAFLLIWKAMLIFAVVAAGISVSVLSLKREEQESSNEEADEEINAQVSIRSMRCTVQ
jgi:hypothetical protein